MRRCSSDRLSALSDDSCLAPYRDALRARRAHVRALEQRLVEEAGDLAGFAQAHAHFGLHRSASEWVLREWAPHANAVHLLGDFCGWAPQEAYALQRVDARGSWELRLPADTLTHGAPYRLHMGWEGGGGDRIPAYARRVVQDPATRIFNAQVWAPPAPYAWQHPRFRVPFRNPLIYESHVGMAQEHGGVGTYDEFREHVLPRIADAGYNTVQLMAVLEHPYYGSFGYQVTSFFAPSSRFGTPDELKALIDAAHGMGLAVVIDLVHSHAARNEVEGLSRFDGTRHQYFHDGARGEHPAWDSRCFDYGKAEVLHFLLSNCRYWLDEFRVDGFRFDGVTSMLYRHHGFAGGFNSYDDYFNASVDGDALAYLTLANKLIHGLRPDAMTIAEDVSGMPGLAAPLAQGGCGFDFRLAMGVTDCWVRLVRDVRDEDWDLAGLWRELTNRRADERVISYAECHDQAIVGSKTLIFELIDAAMYDHMKVSDRHFRVERGIALHKMIRLATLTTAGHGYLNFMGNEFGHPEWIDFPREGNHWSHHYARRQWHLRDDPVLKYHNLADFDRAMLDLDRGRGLFGQGPARRLVIDPAGKILAYERSGLYLFFNFHCAESVVDYPVEVLPGTYELVLDTDAPRFGGQGRVPAGQRYAAEPVLSGDALRHCVHLYLPCRVALVLHRVSSPPRLVIPTPAQEV